MSLAIPNVPLDTLTPGVYFGIDGSQAARGLPGMPRRLLLLGDKTSAGSAALNTPIQVVDSNAAPALFGAGSPLATMVKEARAHNPAVEMWAMPVASGTNASEMVIEVTAGPVINYSAPSRGQAWAFTFTFTLGGSPIVVPVTYTAAGSGAANSADFQAAAAAYGAAISAAISAYATVSVSGAAITITADAAAAGVWTFEHNIPMTDNPVLVVNGDAHNNAGTQSETFEAAAGSGSAAIGSITVTTSSPKAGTLSLYVAGVLVAVPVQSTDTATVVAARIATAINGKAHLPVTATSALGVVTVTAKWAGTTSNQIDLRANVYPDQATPSGVTVAFSQPAGGAGLPDAEAIIAALGDTWYTAVVSPWADGSVLSPFEAWLENRDGAMDPLPGHVFAALNANLSGLVAAGSARNSRQSTILGVYGVAHPDYQWAAACAALAEYEAALDPARPIQQDVQIKLLAPAIAQRLTRSERETLLRNGISTFTVSETGAVYVERLITTYQTSSLGIPDVAWLDLEVVNTVEYIRYAVRTRIASKFPRMKLADDGTRFAPGQPIVTPSVIRAEMIALARELENVGLMENVEQFQADLRVERSQSDRNRVNVVFPPDVVNQLRVVAGTVQFRL